MMPVYILSITLLFTSVIKVTDLFKEADKNLNKKRSLFIQKTRKLHHQNNEKGSISLMAALFTVMFSALLMYFVFKFKVELKEARYRKDSYLCFHYLNIQTENYIKDMAKFNLALRGLYAATFSVSGSAQARALFEATKIARNGRHFYYVKNLLKNNYCAGKSDSLSYLKNFPFKTSGALVLKTNIDATTNLKDHSWTITHYKNPSGIRLKNSFCLQAIFTAKGPFLPGLKVETAEIPMAGFSKLKCLSGSR